MRQQGLILVLASALLAACAVGVGPDDTSLASDASPTPQLPQGDASSPPPSNGNDASVAEPDAGSTSTLDSGSSSACASKFTGTLVTFDFSADPGNQLATAPKSAAAGITAGSLTRSGSLTAVSGASSINASNWATAAKLDPTRYYAFTITPDPNCALDLGSVSIDSKSSSSGPTSGAVATSDDKFATATSFAAGTAVAKVTLSVSQASNAVEVRVYGYNATGAAGTMRLQTTLSVSGALK